MENSADISSDQQQKSIIDERVIQLSHIPDLYITQHPELQHILTNFITELLTHKPQDITLFAREYFSKINPTPLLNKPLALIGPSGAGKSTLIKALMTQFPGVFEFSISSTTRKPRGAEQNGVEYYFITKEEFKSKIEAGDFIEYAEVHENYYGTSKAAVEDIAKRGKICILDIDVQGAIKIFEAHIEFNRVFVMPKTINDLEERLRKRGTDNEDTLRVRLRNAEIEINTARNNPEIFPDFVVNDVLDEAYRDFLNLIYRYYGHLKG